MPNEFPKEIKNLMPKRDGEIISCRELSAPFSFDENEKSFRIVATTETPVLMPDWDRWEMSEEKLLVSGMELPEVKEIPLLDNHNRNSIDDILGRFTNITPDESKGLIEGKAILDDEDPKAKSAANKIRKGILTDGSVGYRVLEETYIPQSESVAINGKSYKASDKYALRVVTKWRLYELSLTPIGADEKAKIRTLFQKVISEKEIHKGGVKPMEPIEKKEAEKTETQQPPVDLEAVRKEASEHGRKQELERQKEIRSMCKDLIADEKAQEFIDSGRSIQEIKDLVIEEMKRSKAPVSTADFDLRAGMTQGEKFRAAAVDALAMSKVKIEKPADGAQGMSRMGFVDLARECLHQMGIRSFGMGKEEILRHAMGRSVISPRFSSRTPSMGTSDFSYILANSANKVLLKAFEQTDSTYQDWMQIGSLADFKTYDRVRLSDAPAFDLVPEGGAVKYGNISDSREQIKLYTYAKNLAFTREALISDDLNAFNMFAMYGSAAKRKIEAVAYSPITDNVTMADTGALFNTTAVTTTGGHANLAASGAAPSPSTWSDAEIAMWAQKGPNGAQLGLRPRYVIFGIYHKSNIFILLNSFALPTAGMSSGVANPIEKNNSGIIPIMSPVFASTNTAWHLACSYMQEPTIEVAFLDGVQAPTMTEFDQGPDTLGKVYQAVIDVAAKPLSYRGLYKNAGA